MNNNNQNNIKLILIPNGTIKYTIPYMPHVDTTDAHPSDTPKPRDITITVKLKRGIIPLIRLPDGTKIMLIRK